MNNTPKSMPLTARQATILRFIGECLAEQNRPPTIRDIMKRFDINSQNGVRYHLMLLHRKGCIVVASKSSRGIQITGLREKIAHTITDHIDTIIREKQ